MVQLVEAIAAYVAGENPEERITEALFKKAGAGSCDEREADSAAPLRGVNIERAELSVLRQVGIARGHGGDKAVDGSLPGREDGLRFALVRAPEVVARSPILGTKPVEVFGRQKPAIGGLPRADVDMGDAECIFRLGGPQLHDPLLSVRVYGALPKE